MNKKIKTITMQRKEKRRMKKNKHRKSKITTFNTTKRMIMENMENSKMKKKTNNMKEVKTLIGKFY
jgi:cell fate (sporulation/competence/biofilm development) regulator YlbF (YheA/YmcA/DUF963 family)